MTKNEAVTKVLNLARGEIGYHEQGTNVTKYAEYLDSYAGFYNGAKNGYAWCDVFVDYLFVKSFGLDTGREMICQPMNSAGAGCLYSAQYYKDAGRWVTQPQPGDQIFFSYAPGEYSHTGIVESVGSGTVTTIEGNTSDMVARRNYALASNSIVGYGRPNWDLVAEKSEEDFADIEIPEPQKEDSGYGTVILRKGSKGIAVRELQEKLIGLGYNLGRYGADGDFGSDTYKAVKQFQQEHDLYVDGEVGENTYNAIEAEIMRGTGAAPVQTTAGIIRPDLPSVIIGATEHVDLFDDEFEVDVPATTAAAVEDSLKFKVGDTVNFVGSGHYLSAIAKFGMKCKPGKATVTAVNKSKTARHPYRVRAVRGSGSTVNGWVDEDALEAI